MAIKRKRLTAQGMSGWLRAVAIKRMHLTAQGTAGWWHAEAIKRKRLRRVIDYAGGVAV